jgi:hypothetical protein
MGVYQLPPPPSSTTLSIILGSEAAVVQAQRTNVFGYTLSDNEDKFEEEEGDKDRLLVIGSTFATPTRGIKPNRVKSKHSWI